LKNRPTKSEGTGEGQRRPGEGGVKKMRLGAKGKILTVDHVDEKTTRDTSKRVAKQNVEF
jgi:hypothetical protein